MSFDVSGSLGKEAPDKDVWNVIDSNLEVI